MHVKPGDKIMVKINGVEIETVIDERGVQRLPCNRVIDYMMGCHLHNFNWLGDEVCKGRFTQEERRLIYQNVGYSLCGYMEVFGEDEIENPLWDEEKPVTHEGHNTLKEAMFKGELAALLIKHKVNLVLDPYQEDSGDWYEKYFIRGEGIDLCISDLVEELGE